jgi:uncharacterized protein (DUF885 family)
VKFCSTPEMRRLLVLLLVLPAYGFGHSPASEGTKAVTASAALKELFEQSDAADLDRNPMKALERGDTRYAARLGYDLSDSHFARERSATATDLRRLRSIDRTALPPPDQIAYDAFKWRREMDRKLLAPAIVDLLALRPIEHFTGFHLDYADLASGSGVAPFNTLSDYEDNLKRHHEYAAFIDTVIVRLRQGMARDIVQPKIIVLHVIKQLDDQIAAGVDGSLFLAPVNNLPQSIPPETHERLKEQYRDAIRNELLPALSRLDTFLRQEYLARARDSIGLAEMRGGRKLYRVAIEENTTLPLTPEYVHRFGLAEVARITAEMEAVKSSAGFRESLHDFFVYLRSDPRFRVPDDEWALKRFESEQEQIDRHLGEQFASSPKSRLQIQPEPKYKRPPGGRKTGASGYYQGGTPDGSRPGIFFFEVATTPEMDSLFLHEGMPGHHLQVSLAQENSQIPAFMRFGDCAAYEEGWALYAETLWREMGVESDPFERFGGLSAQLVRAIRLVVDTGIHAKGWSRERAIQYIVDHSPAGNEEAASAVDRYAATPGQALAYQIGLSTILKLKAKAKVALGAHFDPRAFHEQILNAGSLPLTVLTAKLNQWTSRERRMTSPDGSQQRAAP